MPPVNFKLKHYQQKTLDDYRTYLKKCVKNGAKVAFIECTDMPYKAAPCIKDEVPYICLRIPTGGGKTIMAAYAVGITTQEYLRVKNPMVLWLVPSDAIREQTISALKDINHPYRSALANEFGHNISILSKDEAFSLSKADAGGNACIIVATIQSFRRKTDQGKSNPDGLKVYQASGSLMNHFTDLHHSQKSHLDKTDGTNGPIPSLANLLKLHRPMVIVDEAHNLRTELSFETLAKFDPSIILEMTATPIRDGDKASNILSMVSAAGLKVEEMIKMPINLITNPNWTEAVKSAVDCQKNLEKIAKAEKENTGEYIRPIILFQAQPERGDDPINWRKLKNYLVNELQIPAEQVAVQTGKYNDLNDVDVKSSDCPIRYIITVQKLKEGWDCPFAYILCSVATQNSTTAVEQILGRVLRMPKAKRKHHDELNQAYAFVASPNFNNAARQLQDGLVKGAGFENIEAEKFIQQHPRLPLNYNTNKNNGINLIPDNQKDDFKIPLLAFHYQGHLQLFKEDHFLNFPWPLEKCDAAKITDFFSIQNNSNSGKLDVEDDGNVAVSFIKNIQSQTALIEPISKLTKIDLIKWLAHRVKNKDVTSPSAIEFYSKAVEYLIENKYSVDQLTENKNKLSEALKECIKHFRSEREKNHYDAMFSDHNDKFKLSSEISINFSEQSYSYNQPYNGKRSFNKHYTEIIGDMKDSGEEFECACYLDECSEVKYWIRNVDRQPNAFWLQLSNGKFYPDFIALLNDGRILVVEYKGSHLIESQRIKKYIGEFWAEISEGKCLFCMPTNQDYDLIKRTITSPHPQNNQPV
jgi:superfamily II DNA or RNA helicase